MCNTKERVESNRPIYGQAEKSVKKLHSSTCPLTCCELNSPDCDLLRSHIDSIGYYTNFVRWGRQGEVCKVQIIQGGSARMKEAQESRKKMCPTKK